MEFYRNSGANLILAQLSLKSKQQVSATIFWTGHQGKQVTAGQDVLLMDVERNSDVTTEG